MCQEVLFNLSERENVRLHYQRESTVSRSEILYQKGDLQNRVNFSSPEHLYIKTIDKSKPLVLYPSLTISFIIKIQSLVNFFAQRKGVWEQIQRVSNSARKNLPGILLGVSARPASIIRFDPSTQRVAFCDSRRSSYT